jgi:hypothetical protein
MSTSARRAIATVSTLTGGACFVACFPNLHSTKASLTVFVSAMITVALSVGYLRRSGGQR